MTRCLPRRHRRRVEIGRKAYAANPPSQPPPALLQHLLDRLQQHRIDHAQLALLAAWLDTQPIVPFGPWFKRFPGMTVCGEGDLVKTFLTFDQAPFGEELR